MLTRRYILLLLLFICIFFTKQLFFGEVFYCCDNIAINIPSKVFLIEQLWQGRFPLWNPYILSGSPFLADINLGLLYPLNALYFVFSPFRALTMGIIIDFVLAAIGMYVLGRSLKFSQFAATVSAVIFTFSGTLVVYTNNVPMLQVAALLPWVAWAWTRYFDNPINDRYLMLVGLLTLQIFAGHPQLTYYTWLFGVAYIIFVSPISAKRKLFSFLSVSGLVFLLSAIQIVPFIELVRQSTRLGLGFAYASFDSLHLFTIIRLVVPNIVGNLSKGTDWIQGGSMYGYVGMLPLIFLFFVPWKNTRVRFFVGLTTTSFLLALGRYTPVFFVFYTLIPGIGSFRSPAHFLLLYTFGVAILAGFSVNVILRRSIFFRLVFGVGTCLIAAAVIFETNHVVLPVAKFHTLAPVVQKTVVRLIADNMLLSGLLLLGVGTLPFVARKNISLERIGILFAVFLELFLLSRHGFVAVEQKQIAVWLQSGTEMAKRMTDADYGQYRIFVTPALYANPVKKQFGIPYSEKETAWQLSILRTNINMLYHLSTIDGYASLIYRPYKELFQKGEGDPTGIEFTDLASLPWNQLGVRYVLASPKEAIFKNNPTFTPIWSDGNRIVYKNPHALPKEDIGFPFQSTIIIVGALFTTVGWIIFATIFFGRR